MRGRTLGVRNADYEQKRNDLAVAMVDVVVSEDTVSLQRLASAAGVSVPTVRHYFGDREGAVAAAIHVIGERSAPHLERLIATKGNSVEDVLYDALNQFVVGWRQFGVGAVIERCLSLGLLNQSIGHAVVDDVLEPTIDALEQLLTQLLNDKRIEEGVDVRHSALSLVSPILIALLHQDGLDGANCRHLDVDAFVKDHVKRFVRGICS